MSTSFVARMLQLLGYELYLSTQGSYNLEVTMLYAQVKVIILLVVTVQLVRDHWSSKLDSYGVRGSLILLLMELLYCNNREGRHVMLNHTIPYLTI